jgi:hypothetical protein
MARRRCNLSISYILTVDGSKSPTYGELKELLKNYAPDVVSLKLSRGKPHAQDPTIRNENPLL